MNLYKSLIPIILLLLCLPHIGISQPLTKHSTERYEPIDNTVRSDDNQASQNFIRFYQKYLSAVRGASCPMYPSCSEYGLQVFKTYPLTKAFAATSDRLMRCGHEHKLYPLTTHLGELKYLDLPSGLVPDSLIADRGQGKTYAYRGFDDNKVNDLIIFLINNGRYREALLEIYRQQIQFSQNSLFLIVNKLKCFNAMQEFENCVYEYEARLLEDERSQAEVTFEAAYAHYRLKNYNTALLLLKRFEDNPPTDALYKQKIYTLIALSFAAQGNYTEAEKIFNTYGDFEINKNNLAKSLIILEEGKKQKNKNLTLAGVLGIVPGLGYTYAGYSQSGLTAFLIIGALGYATYSNIVAHNWGMSILTGAFTLSFYSGSITGSVKGARRFNESKRFSLLRKLENINKI